MSRPSHARAPWLLLGTFVLVLLAMSWQRWGNPVSDPGLDLVVASGWLHGIQPYSDVRYFYGPLGIGGLAATFAVLGSSLGAAYAFGLLQTAVIAELWRRLARRWLPPAVVVAGLAVVLAIGFSGSLFNFQLPHTAAATTGLAALLAVLLAVSHGRYGWAGVAIGLAALTRPEFLAFAIAALGGAALGRWREDGFRAAVVSVLLAIPGAVLVAGIVLGYFAQQAGAERLFTENLFPVDFVRTVGGRFEEAWHPYDLPSAGTLLLRGVLIGGGAWTVLRVVEAWGYVRPAGVPGSRRVRVLAGPVLVFVAAVALTVVLATVLGAAGGDAGQPVKDVGSDVGRLLLPMTALPAITFVVLAVAAIGWLRKDVSPLGLGWAADLSLIAVAAACGLRAYGMFSTDVYATYFAPPAVLVAAIVLYRGAGRVGARQLATTGWVLSLAAVALAAHAYIGRYSDQTFTVRAPHGTYRADATAGPNIQRVIDLLAPRVAALEPETPSILVLPQEPGFQFLLGARPAQYNDTFLPGTLASQADDRAAANALLSSPPQFVIVAARRLDDWGFKANGVDVNTALMTAVNGSYCVVARFGDTEHPPSSDLPANAFTVYERSGSMVLLPGAGYGADGQPVPAPPPRDC